MDKLDQSSDCKQKLVEMQKYLPFLDKIIERMKCMAGKAEIVLQMEQLHRALLGDIPDERVEFEDLRKCEAVLMKIYNDNDDSDNELENIMTISQEETVEHLIGLTKEIIKDDIPANNNHIEKTDEININSNGVNDIANNSTSITHNISIPVTNNIDSECEEKLQNNAEELNRTNSRTSQISNDVNIATHIVVEVENSTTSQSSKVENKNVKSIADNKQNGIQNIMRPQSFHDSKKKFIETTAGDKNDISKNITKDKVLATTIETVKNMNETSCKKSIECDNISLTQSNESDTNKSNALAEIVNKSVYNENKELLNSNFTEDVVRQLEESKKGGIDTKMQNGNETDTCHQQNNVTIVDVDDNAECDYEDYEANVELIKIPEETADEEMILPDSADESEQSELSDSSDILSDREKMYHDDDNNTEDANYVHNKDDKNETKESKKSDSETMKNHKVGIKEPILVTTGPMFSLVNQNQNQISGNTFSSGDSLKLGNEDVILPQEAITIQKLPEICVKSSNDDTNNIVTVEDNTIGDQEKILNSTENVSADNIHDDDDDDIQIIEPQNSPICILSDDDDDDVESNTINAIRAFSIVQDNPQSVKRVFARKSTARSTKHPRNTLQKSKPQCVTAGSEMYTIELLDSSDDDDNCIVVHDRKRKLLGTKNPVEYVAPKRKLLPTQSQSTSVENKKPRKQPLQSEMFKGHIVICEKKKPAAPSSLPTYKPTPQSNFLNAINLQPATAGENPPAFCATISNKNIIIPNAFYGNPKRSTSSADTEIMNTSEETLPKIINKSSSPPPPSAVTATITTTTGKKAPAPLIVAASVHKVYREWLDNFLIQFTRPRQLATHTCFVLLQRVLKYKLFTRIKDMRTRLNTMAYNSSEHIDMPLHQELKNIFYKGKQLSENGLRFCQAACTEFGNNITLTTDAHTGYVTARTCSITEPLKKDLEEVDSLVRKRTDDAEYTPGKQYANTGKTGIGVVRRKSLRKQRSRCYDERFFYDEADMVETTEEIERKQAEAEVQRKVEAKRLEAQRQRQQQVKSFENAYIQMFTKNAKHNFPTTKETAKATSGIINQPTTPQISSPSPILMNDINSVGGLDDDEPKQHRIYKVIPTKLVVATKQTPSTAKTKQLKPRSSVVEPEVITCDSIESDTCDSMSELVPLRNKKESNTSTKDVPLNTNIHLHPLNGRADWCVICHCRVPRTVDHYVNKHRNAEVYISRLPKARVERFRRNKGNIGQVSFYKTGQPQYEAVCAFCNRMKRFMLPYWQHHFAMHTGEYAYRCSGCGLRKPTRSPMTLHVNRPCNKRGKVQIDYHYDAKLKNIEGFFCTICNYTQLHRHNVLQHLRTQHNLKKILPHHMETIVLLSIPNVSREENGQSRSNSSLAIDDNSNEPRVVYECDDYPGAQAGQWDETDATDEMSLMIFGMLDVQMDEN